MALNHGAAVFWRRRDKLLVVAASLTVGAAKDERGVWSGVHVIDFDACCMMTPWPASDEVVGLVLRQALKASRLGRPIPEAWARGVGSDKAEMDARLAAEFGLPDARRLYQGMLSPGADWALDTLTIWPSRRRHGGRFEGFEPAFAAEHQPVALPFASPDAALGAAVRLCLERCL